MSSEGEVREVEGAMQEDPFAGVVLGEEWDGKLCFCCMRLPGKFRCNGCSQAWYCSAECQNLDWGSAQHPVECAVFSSASPSTRALLVGAPILRLAFRAWSRYYAESEELWLEAELGGMGVEGGDEAKSKDHPLKSSLDLVAADAAVNKELVPFMDELTRVYGLEIGEVYKQDFSSIVLLAVRQFKKVMQWGAESGRVVGLALYSYAYPHSCVPTLSQTFYGSLLTVWPYGCGITESETKSFCLIREEDPRLMLTRERQGMLWRKWGLCCACPLCQDTVADEIKSNGLKIECNLCGESLVPRRVSASSLGVALYCLRCSRVRTKVDAEEWSVVEGCFRDCSHLKGGKLRLDEPKEFDKVRKLVKLAEKILHPRKNLLLYRLRQAVFASLSPLQTRAFGIPLGEGMYNTMLQYSSSSPARALLAGKLGKLYGEAGFRKEGKEWCQKARADWERGEGNAEGAIGDIGDILDRLEVEEEQGGVSMFNIE